MSSFMRFCCEGLPVGRYHYHLVLEFGSNVRVCSEGLRLVDPLGLFL